MSLKNRYNFWKIKQNLAPSRDFKIRLQRDLSLAWNVKYGRPSWLQIGLLHKGAALAAVVLLLIGSTGAYAYVSPEVTEGTMLYPLKQAVESVEEVTKITPEAKAKFYLKQIKRRELEKEKLTKNAKLRAEVKNRLEIRLEKRKKQLEEKIERQTEKLEKFKELRKKGR